MGVTERVADITASTSFGSLSPEAVATVKRVILDGVSVTAAGSEEEAVHCLQEYAKEIRGAPACSVVGAGFKTSAPMAAFINGASCHVLDYEVMWNNHPTSPVLPALLALAEWKGFSGKDVITAFALGMEIQGRLRMAGANPDRVDPFEIIDHFPGLHYPSVVGPLAGAAACSRLPGLDSMKTRMAIGMAASRVGGVFANVGSDTKCQHCGHACRMGLESALLAQQGATANPDIIEAYQGFAETIYLGDFNLGTVIDRFGNPYLFIEEPPNFKRLPSNTNTQTCMEAVLELRQKYSIDPAQVNQVIIEGPVSRYVDRPFPQTGLEGKQSYQYATSVALLEGEVTIDSFRNDRRLRPDMDEMLRKVRLTDNPEPSLGAERLPFGGRLWKRVTVRMKDGREHSARVEMPHGFVGGRALTREEHLAKVRDCLTRVVSPQEADWCIGLLGNLENASPDDIAGLMDTLRC